MVSTDLEPGGRDPIPEVRLALRHRARLDPVRVTANGSPVTVEGETAVRRGVRVTVRVVCGFAAASGATGQRSPGAPQR